METKKTAASVKTMGRMMKKCKLCGKQFKPQKPKREWCEACRDEFKRDEYWNNKLTAKQEYDEAHNDNYYDDRREEDRPDEGGEDEDSV